MNKDAVAEMGRQYQVEAAQKLVPEGYKQTEVGVIPEDWGVSNIGSILSITTGNKNTQDKIDNGIYPFFVRSQHVERINTFSFDGEAVLTAGDGVGTGKIFHYINGKFDFHQRVYLMYNFGERVDGYYFYLFFSNNFYDRIMSMTAKSSVDSVRREMISEMLIALPSINEQKAIANALSDTDALLSELEKLIAKKQAIKTATMQQLLTGRTRLPQFAHHPDGSKKGYKQSELGEIPEDWEAIQLGEIATFLKGAGLPKSDLIDSGKNRCIHYGQLFTSYGPKIEKIFSSTDIDGSIKSETNDVLMPTSDVTPNGLATASCILESGIVLGGDILIIRSKKELLDGVFFAYLITVMRDQIMQLVTGSTVYHLYGSDMARFFFARPSIDEQTAIATILADMDEEIQALEHRLNKTRQIKQGMMQELLTGKTRLVVPQD